MATFEAAIPTILEHEGDGHGRAAAGDPGGATRWGITHTTLDRARELHPELGLPASVADLSREQAIAIYRALWWNPQPYASVVDERVATKILDCDVNMGPNAHRIVQKALNCIVHAGLPEIPHFGPQTLAAVNRADPTQLLLLIGQLQAEHYRNWISHDPAERERDRKGLMARAAWPFPGRALLAA